MSCIPNPSSQAAMSTTTTLICCTAQETPRGQLRCRFPGLGDVPATLGRDNTISCCPPTPQVGVNRLGWVGLGCGSSTQSTAAAAGAHSFPTPTPPHHSLAPFTRPLRSHHNNIISLMDPYC